METVTIYYVYDENGSIVFEYGGVGSQLLQDFAIEYPNHKQVKTPNTEGFNSDVAWGIITGLQ